MKSHLGSLIVGAVLLASAGLSHRVAAQSAAKPPAPTPDSAQAPLPALKPTQYNVQLYHNKKRKYDGPVANAQLTIEAFSADDYLRIILDGPNLGPAVTVQIRGVHGDTIRTLNFRKVDPAEGVQLLGKDLVRSKRKLLGKTLLWYVSPQGQALQIGQLVVGGFD